MSLLFSCLGAREYAYAAFGLLMPFFHRKTRQASIIAWKRCPVCSRRRRTGGANRTRSEEHTSELQSLMRISYAVFCLKKKKENKKRRHQINYLHLSHPTNNVHR